MNASNSRRNEEELESGEWDDEQPTTSGSQEKRVRDGLEIIMWNHFQPDVHGSNTLSDMIIKQESTSREVKKEPAGTPTTSPAKIPENRKRKAEEVIAGPRGSKIIVSVEPQADADGNEGFVSEDDDDESEQPPVLQSQVEADVEKEGNEETNEDDLEFGDDPAALTFIPSGKVRNSL